MQGGIAKESAEQGAAKERWGGRGGWHSWRSGRGRAGRGLGWLRRNGRHEMILVVRYSRFVLASLAALAIACRLTGPAAVIDPGMGSCVSPDTVVLAGLDVAEVRSSALFQKLPAAASFLEPFHEADHLLLAFDGKDLLTIAHGAFRTAPVGGTLVEPGLALFGSDAATRAAVERHKRGSAGPARLLSEAASVIAGKSIWIVAEGGVALPLTGNAANLNRLLRDSEFGALTASLGPRIQIEGTAVGRNAEAARNVEETLRAVLAMMAMAEKRGSESAALLNAVEIRREDRTVHAVVWATPYGLAKLLEP